MNEPEDDDLLAATPEDGDAFAEFYRRHESTVLAYFVRRTGRPDLAADLAAETFAAALLAARRYRPGPAPAIAWLLGIARHKLMHSLDRRRVEDAARRRLTMPALVLNDDMYEAIEALGADDRAEAMLKGLTPVQAAAVRARIIDEESYAEIARRLECSEAVVRKRVSRGLAQLKSLKETREA